MDVNLPPSPASIFVVVLTYNQCEKTLACLEHLFISDDIPFQVLVWDNGSHDGTVEAVQQQFPQVITHYSLENLGVAGGRNAAAQFILHHHYPTHILFLDNDIVVESGFVRALFQPFLVDPTIGQTQAKLRFMHDHRLINDGGGARISFTFWRVKPVGFGEVDQGQYDSPRECISCGGAMMVRAEVFRELNGFDPLFGPFGPEDLDFSLRLKKLGYKAMYIPGAIGYHQVSHTYGGDYNTEYARHKSRHWMLFMRRHATIRQKIMFYFVGAPVLAIQVFIREARRGNLGAIRGLLQGIFNTKR